MKKVRQKLNNNDGVTLLIALIGFMVAAMISIVIVSAAVTSANRVANDRKTNQAHLTLESAAQIVRDDIETMKYTYTVDDDGTITPGTVSCDSQDAGKFSSEIENAIKAIENGTSEYTGGSKTSPAFTMSLNNDSVEKVNVTFIMKNKESGTDMGVIGTGTDTDVDGPKYDLYFTLSIDGSDQELYLTMDGRIKKVNDTVNSKTYQVTWSTMSINEIGEQSADAD